MAERRAPSGEYTKKAEKITDPLRIAAMLERLWANRCLLTVLPDNSHDAYNSALLEIHAQQGYLVLDELNPKAGHERLLVTRRLKVHTRLNGVELSFAGLVESVGQRDGIGFYRVTFPGVLHYYQRRAHYRAKVGPSKRVPVTLTLSQERQVTGWLRDISVGGIGASFPPAFPESLAHSGQALGCTIHLPSGAAVICRIELCFVNHSLQDNTRVIGARFLGLRPAQQRTVARFVAELDREQMKKLTNK